MNIYDMAASVPWCITQEALEVILAIAARDDLPVWAVESAKGRQLDNTRSVTTRNGVAIIPINGSLVRHGDMFTDVSGAVSVNALAQDFTTALNDRSVRAILFNIDSPGGEINGISEFSDMVYAARGEKPIHAYISHLGCSAAYWIASACDHIVCDATASVGSIGVIAAVPNPEKDSKRTVQFVSSQSPRKRLDITTEKGREDIQARIDALAEVFVTSVARNRGVATDRVLEDFGGGGVFVGAAARDAGLVNSVGSFESTLSTLAALTPSVFAARAAHDTGTTNAGALVGEDARDVPAKQNSGAMPRRGKTVSFWTKLTRQEREDARQAGASLPDESEISAIDQEVERRVAEERATFNRKLAESNAARLQSEAAHKADELTRAGKLYPAQREHFIEARVQAAVDDATNPRQGATSRVATLDAGYELAAGHGLFTERINPSDKAQTLSNQAGGDASNPLSPAGAAASARKFAEQMNKNGKH